MLNTTPNQLRSTPTTATLHRLLQQRTTTMTTNIFERLSKGRPTPVEVTNKQTQKIQHAQRMLNWILRWPKSYIRTTELRIYGPRPRDRESAISAATILVEQGWLRPLPTNRYDGNRWQIVRKPIIRPTLAK